MGNKKRQKYYGDKDGNAVIGKKTIDGKEYFFNHLGELMYGWFRDDDLFWIYSDENGILRSGHMEGIQEFYIPSYVDRMKISDLAGAGRQFYIKCEPGSYAESFALEKGIQYDNGVKRVIGYDISTVDEKVKWVVSNYVHEGMSERQIADVLNYWLQTNAHYDGTLTRYSASGVLLEGYGVCESYALAYELLLNEAGIESCVVSGRGKNYGNSDDPGHAWTMLRVDGQWYHCNVTGGDRSKPSDPVITAADNTISGPILDEQFGKIWAWDHESYSADKNRVGWITCKGKTFYYDGSSESGRHIGWLNTDGGNTTYYFDETGTLVTGDAVIDGVAYHFDDWGHLTGDQPVMRNGLFYDDGSGWRLFSNGQFAGDYTGLYCDANLGWWLVRNGSIDFGYTGLWNDPVYGWWLIGGGQVAMDYTGLWNDPNLGWWLIGGGQICWDYVGLWNDPSYGWWLIDHGTIAWNYTGLWNDPSYGWWLIGGGQIAFDYTGLWNDPSLGWWLIGGGQICFDYVGLWNDPNYGWWLIDHGAIASYYNGLWEDPICGTWMIQNGTIDWSYAGG